MQVYSKFGGKADVEKDLKKLEETQRSGTNEVDEEESEEQQLNPKNIRKNIESRFESMPNKRKENEEQQLNPKNIKKNIESRFESMPNKRKEAERNEAERKRFDEANAITKRNEPAKDFEKTRRKGADPGRDSFEAPASIPVTGKSQLKSDQLKSDLNKKLKRELEELVKLAKEENFIVDSDPTGGSAPSINKILDTLLKEFNKNPKETARMILEQIDTCFKNEGIETKKGPASNWDLKNAYKEALEAMKKL